MFTYIIHNYTENGNNVQNTSTKNYTRKVIQIINKYISTYNKHKHNKT